jgi:hypothetical protein
MEEAPCLLSWLAARAGDSMAKCSARRSIPSTLVVASRFLSAFNIRRLYSSIMSITLRNSRKPS